MIIFLSIFLLLFILLEKFNEYIRLNYEQNMMIQESKLKELYYKEIDKNNLKLRKISHDIKNRLLPLIDLNEENIEFAKATIQSLFDEYSNIEGEIFTKNNALNSICKIKLVSAKSLNIKVIYEIDLPEVINISYGDMGIVFGNLLDNAIEACEWVEEDLRFIDLKVKLFNDCMLVTLENSKHPDYKVDKGFKTIKKDKVSHGFGMRSIRDIVNKYEGTLEAEDLKDRFRINIMMNGVVK